MNNPFVSQSSSILVIMLIIFGISALIKIAIRLFEILVKLAFILIILFLGFKALEFTLPSTNSSEFNAPITDTLKTDTLVVTLKHPTKNRP